MKPDEPTSTDILPLPQLPRRVLPSIPQVAAPHGRVENSSSVGLVAAGTLALWLSCLTVGVLGLWLQYPSGRMAAADLPPVKIIHVDLSDDPSPTDTDAAPSNPAPPPPDKSEIPPALPAPAIPPDAPPLMSVATPNPEIAFALPVEGPSQIVEAKQAAPAPPQPAAAVAAPARNPGASAVHQLTFGKGEGAQPSPEYPREAIIARQEGAVSVRFTVAENGKVTAAEVVSPCRWPMLNQAALRAIRDRWHFAPGDRRLYEISIHFQLTE